MVTFFIAFNFIASFLAETRELCLHPLTSSNEANSWNLLCLVS